MQASESCVANTGLFPDTTNWQLSDFSFRHLLGTGSYGKVRLCVHKPSNEIYAVKCLKKAENLRPAKVQHILSEARIMCNIEHPFIIKLCQTFQDEHQLYMVLEYASGGDIWKHIRDLGRFSNEVARFYSAEVVLALDYLHSQHIIYYDLKPENLMLDAAGHVKLIDFGFARSTTDECTAVRGTPEYLAPEVVEGGHHSVMVDWWALGCLVYEMMVYDKILRGHIRFPWWLNRDAKDLMKRLLLASPTERLGANGAAEIQQHVWYQDMNWRKLLKKKVPPPCLTPQQGALPMEETEGSPTDLSEPHFKHLNAEQQALFKAFGPYEEGMTAETKSAWFRPKWLVRRERRAKELERRQSHIAVVSGYTAGDLLLTVYENGHMDDLVKRGLEISPKELSAEQQHLFESFGPISRRESTPPSAKTNASCLEALPKEPLKPLVPEADGGGPEPAVEVDRTAGDRASRSRRSTVMGVSEFTRSGEISKADELETWVIVHEDRPVPKNTHQMPEPDPWVLINRKKDIKSQNLYASFSCANESFHGSPCPDELWSPQESCPLMALLKSSWQAGDLVVVM